MPLRADILNPIPGDNPSGANLRYDPVYDQIKEARRKDDEGPQGLWQRERKVADFRTVYDLTTKSLAERSKDLQLAVWLTEALLHREKFAGLQQSIDLLRGLLEQFWDTLYPEIEDDDLEPRAALLQWVGERLDDQVRMTPITKGGLGYFKFKESRAVGSEEEAAQSEAKKESRDAAIAEGKCTLEDFDKDAAATPTAQYESWAATIDGTIESIKSLDTFCEEKFGQDAPSFMRLRTALEEVRQVIGQILRARAPQEAAEPEPEPEAESAESWQSAETMAAAPAPAKKRTGAISVEPESLDDVTARLHAVAKFLRVQDSSSPAPYLLLRGYRWGELRSYGDSPDISALVPPPTEVRQTLKRLATEYNWTELMEAAEEAMAQPYGRAWLDLQRHVVNAAEQNSYGRIANAIRSELRALLTDYPNLPSWEFSDETPVANGETKAWLKEITAKAPASASVETVPPAPVFEEPASHAPVDASAEPMPPDVFVLAVEAVRAGRTSEAIQMIAEEIPRQYSGRARFQRKLQLAQICMMAGHETLAQPMLEELAQSIDQHKLEEWEAADAVSQPLAMLYKCIAKHADAETKQKLYARISRLDPVRALECGR